MKYKILIIAIMAVLMLIGCSKPNPWGIVSKIEQFTSSGPVSPSFQWEREIVFEDGELDVVNNAIYHDDVINIGRWTVPVRKHLYDDLFEKLSKHDPDLVELINRSLPYRKVM